VINTNGQAGIIQYANQQPDPVALINLADAEKSAKNFKAMGLIFDKVLALEPGNSFALIGKAYELQNEGRFKEAIPIYERAIELAPNKQVEAYSGVAVMYGNVKRFPEAEIRFKNVLQMKPDYSNARFNYANTLRVTPGRGEEAIYHYKQTVAGNPRNPGFADTYNNMGATYNMLKRNEEAADTWKYALKLQPTRGDMWGNLAIAYNSFNKMDDAIRAAQKALKLTGTEAAQKTLKVLQEKAKSMKGK
jgi:tetratricopeptide (TPR) repeat protein